MLLSRHIHPEDPARGPHDSQEPCKDVQQCRTEPVTSEHTVRLALHLWSREVTGHTGKGQAWRKHASPLVQGSVLVLRPGSLDSARASWNELDQRCNRATGHKPGYMSPPVSKPEIHTCVSGPASPEDTLNPETALSGDRKHKEMDRQT